MRKLFECIIPVPVIYHFSQHAFANSIAFDLILPPFRNFRPLKHIKYLKEKNNVNTIKTHQKKSIQPRSQARRENF